MTIARQNIRSSYLLACAMALISPLLKSTVPALIAAAMVLFVAVFFTRAHSWVLGCLALFALALATFGVLLTIHPAILSSYLG